MWAYFYFFPKYTQELEFLDVLLTLMFNLLRTVQVGNLCVVLLLQYEITTCPNSLTFVSGLCVCVRVETRGQPQVLFLRTAHLVFEARSLI